MNQGSTVKLGGKVPRSRRTIYEKTAIVALLIAVSLAAVVGLRSRAAILVSRFIPGNPFQQVADYDAAILVVFQYVHAFDRWPRGWEDLLPDAGKSDPATDRLLNVQRHVKINFSLTLDQVAAMNVDRFATTAVVCIDDPDLGRKDSDIVKLLELARLKAAQARVDQ